MVAKLLALVLLAQPVPAADLASTQEKIDQAAQRFLAKDYEGALAALREVEPAIEQAQDPALARIRFNIARCLEELERWEEALAAYEAYLGVPDESHRKARAWEAVRAIEQRLYGAVEVTCSPANARVYIEGLTVDPRACPLRLDRVRPGTYALQATGAGHADARLEVAVSAGERAPVEVALVPLAAPAVTAAAPAEDPANPWPWVTVGAGVAVAGAGAALTFIAAGRRDDAEALPPGSERDDLVGEFETTRALSYAGYAVGGAAVVGGILWWLLDDGEQAPVAVTPGGVAWAW